jgi:hypothetical protein
MREIDYIAATRSIFAEPGWIAVTLIGAIVGAAIAPMFSILRYLARRFQTHPLCATWYSYHLTFRDNRLVMLSGTYRISRGVRSSLVVRAENLADDETGKSRRTLLYRGTMEQEGGHYVMDLSGRSHKERLMIRFAERIPPNDQTLSGIWLAYDHDNQVAAGAQMFSRTPLDRDTALNALRSWIFTAQAGAIRLRGTPRRTVPTQAHGVEEQPAVEPS